MIEWIFERLGLVIFLVIFVSQVLRAVLRARKAKTEHEARRDDSSEERRVRELQEQIRRRIATRRGGQAPSDTTPPPLSSEPAARPVPRPATTQLPELFGGPLGRSRHRRRWWLKRTTGVSSSASSNWRTNSKRSRTRASWFSAAPRMSRRTSGQ